MRAGQTAPVGLSKHLWAEPAVSLLSHRAGGTGGCASTDFAAMCSLHGGEVKCRN